MMMTTIRNVTGIPPIQRDQRKTTGDGWRRIPATFGRCDSCNQRFRFGEVILWNVHTKLTFHPQCCADPTVFVRPAPNPSARDSANGGEQHDRYSRSREVEPKCCLTVSDKNS